MSALTDQLSNHNDPTSRLSLVPLGAHPATGGVAPSDIIEALSSSEDGIKKSLIIDMKDLVGDAVGNVRYSTSYMRPAHFFSLKIDEHKPLISRSSPCCVRLSLEQIPYVLTFRPFKGVMAFSL
jgi:hypothetical protein